MFNSSTQLKVGPSVSLKCLPHSFSPTITPLSLLVTNHTNPDPLPRMIFRGSSTVPKNDSSIRKTCGWHGYADAATTTENHCSTKCKCLKLLKTTSTNDFKSECHFIPRYNWFRTRVLITYMLSCLYNWIYACFKLFRVGDAIPDHHRTNSFPLWMWPLHTPFQWSPAIELWQFGTILKCFDSMKGVHMLLFCSDLVHHLKKYK